MLQGLSLDFQTALFVCLNSTLVLIQLTLAFLLIFLDMAPCILVDRYL
jgi:hypothetical protein